MSLQRGLTSLWALCIEKNCSLDELSLEEYHQISTVFDHDIYDVLRLRSCVEKRNIIGAPGNEVMLETLKSYKAYLSTGMST